jgi:hypothetical protein
MRFRCSASLRVAALLVGSVPATLAAQGNHADVGIAFRFGTLGLGLEVSKLITSHIAARAGGNYTKFSTTKSQSDITYDATAKFQAFSLLIDLFPGNRGSFHFTGGIMTDPVKVTATGKPTSGNFTINGTSYTAAQVGTLTGEAKFPDVGPYAGIGFGTPARKGAVSFLFDLGAYIGKAKVSLKATGAAANPTLASDLQAQVNKTQKDVDKYAKVYPVLSFGLMIRF